MKIKYSPVKWNPYAKMATFPDTVINPVSEDSLIIDEELYEFDIASVMFPEVSEQTDGHILEAHRDESGELFITVRRFYTQFCQSWDTGEYHEVIW